MAAKQSKKGRLVKRGYAETRFGQLHYAMAGEGEPLILLHQSARSWKSFAKLMDILAPKYQMIAFDYPGFGESDWFQEPYEFTDVVQSVVDGLDSLKVKSKMRLFGHHTGAAVACHIAANYPERVAAAVMSGYPYMESEAERRAYLGISTQQSYKTVKGGPRSLPVTPLEQDGTHLTRLWQRATMRLWQAKNMIPNEGLVSAEEIEFINDWVLDAVKANSAAPVTFQELWKYDSDTNLKKIKAPTLLIQLTGPYERDICQRAHLVQPLVKHAKVAIIERGDIYMIYWRAAEVAGILTRFFDNPAGFKSQPIPAPPAKK